jgi:cytochrome b subunit of formate dehydrogenase
MTREYVRFSVRQRAEHLAIMILFTVLSVTGLPQKFFEYGGAVWILDLLGGVDRARFIHRLAGLLFAALAVVHVSGVASRVVFGGARLTMVPTRQDFRDAIATMRFYLGLSDAQPRFDRFDYRQKFEYWGLILGAVIVIATGLILYWPVLATRLLPGELIPAAKVAHSNEGLLAFLVVILWHVYNAHFNPDVFPFDWSIFTGRISHERMLHEHPLELERLLGRPVSGRDAGHPMSAAGEAAPPPGATAIGGSHGARSD